MISPVSKLEKDSESSDGKVRVNVVGLVGKKQEVYNPSAEEDEKPKRGRPRKTESVNITKAKKDEGYYEKYSMDPAGSRDSGHRRMSETH